MDVAADRGCRSVADNKVDPQIHQMAGGGRKIDFFALCPDY
jgi:hypothetical protein